MIPSRRLLPSNASLRALEALDRLGSASAVAVELSLTQGAISRQLQALEQQLDVDLILRDGKRLALTDAARDYAAQVRQALNQIIQASLQLRVSPTSGALNLAVLPTFGMRWLMPRLPEFSRMHPDVTINMTTRLGNIDFAMEPFDAALQFGNGNWPGTRSLLLKTEQVLAVCSPELLKDRAIAHARDVLSLPLLHIRTRPDAWRDWFDFHNVAPPGPVPGTMYDQFSTIAQAAIHGLGVALLPDYLVEQDLAAGRLSTIWGEPVEMRDAYYLVWPRSGSGNASVKVFRGWLETRSQPEDPLPR